jgi:MoaA/NifB/PqqE/SkfB family radical SAM enzyme
VQPLVEQLLLLRLEAGQRRLQLVDLPRGRGVEEGEVRTCVLASEPRAGNIAHLPDEVLDARAERPLLLRHGAIARDGGREACWSSLLRPAR